MNKKLALVSVFDKSQLEYLAPQLIKNNYKLLATGGTYEFIKKLQIPVLEVSEYTGAKELFSGRVKTLHPKIHGAILLRSGVDEDQWPYEERISLVVVNFYPFNEKQKDIKEIKELMEWVDIGGPTMVRAAAKNFFDVSVLTSPDQYKNFIATLEAEKLTKDYNQHLAKQAFEIVAKLDNDIVRKFNHLNEDNNIELKYGENPHQNAQFIKSKDVKIFGKVGFNNIRDAEGAFRFIKDFDIENQLAACVVKHQTICGGSASISNSDSVKNTVFHYAWEGDSVSRFGGVVAMNFLPTTEVTTKLQKHFIEVLVIPQVDGAVKWANEFVISKPRVKVFVVSPSLFSKNHVEEFHGFFGKLSQQVDGFELSKEISLQSFAEKTAACSKSNAITICGQEEIADTNIYFLAGAGQGQPNRVEALEKLAIPRAKDFASRMELNIEDFICASDAFLPFDDCVKILASNNIYTLVQPGGSKNDQQVLATGKELGVDIITTGIRHFWH